MKKTLEAYLRAKFSARKELTLVHFEKARLSASHDIFMLGVEWQDNGRQLAEHLVVRMEPEIGVHQSYDIERECEAVKRMHANGVPVPRIHWIETDSQVLGHPFVLMEKIEGEKLLNAWIRQPELRPQLLADLAATLVKIHHVDWRAGGLAFLGEPEHSRSFAEIQVDKWQRVLESTQYCAHPVLTEVAIWLKNNAPSAQSTTVCHGDYSVLNAHVHEGRLVAILDWEMVGLGDPVSDIASLCNMAAIMRLPDWDEEAFIRDYEKLTATKVDRTSLAYWKISSLFAAAAVTISGMRAYIESKDPSMKEMFNFHVLGTVLQDIAAKSLCF